MKDQLSQEYIQKNVPSFFHKIEVIDCTESTNDDVKRKAFSINEGYVLISDMQDKGKGRNGKSFYCQPNKGIYMSLLLKPNVPVHYSLMLTALAGVSAIEAISKTYAISSQIKWVNDIFIQDKKIAGILCESALQINSSNLDYLVVGIGINVHSIDMPDHLKEIAASIEDFTSKKVSRNELIIAFLNEFHKYYSELESKSFLYLYRKHSNLINATIDVYENNQIYQAKVINIDEYARLIVQKEDGKSYCLSSGEISVRKK